jgi:3-methyladenine DNA glycosylase/8-oxoguanine DNA glycosylase
LQLTRLDEETLGAQAFGPGADWVIDRAEGIAGLHDDVATFPDLARAHTLVYRLAREHSGLRMPRTGRVFHTLLPTILGQKVTGLEAKRAHSGIVRRYGSPAPGPADNLYTPPDPQRLADTPYYDFHRFGVEQKRADTIRRAAAAAPRLEEAADSATATRRLMAIAGIGPWSAAEVTRVAYGDPDQVSVGDYHIPHQVAWALAGEARGTDDRMLELLAPFAGHRGRVCLLLAVAGITAPRFGPRMQVRSFAKY